MKNVIDIHSLCKLLHHVVYGYVCDRLSANAKLYCTKWCKSLIVWISLVFSNLTIRYKQNKVWENIYCTIGVGLVNGILLLKAVSHFNRIVAKRSVFHCFVNTQAELRTEPFIFKLGITYTLIRNPANHVIFVSANADILLSSACCNCKCNCKCNCNF